MLKYIYVFFMCFFILNIKAQTSLNDGQHFTGAIKIGTGWNYSESAIYSDQTQDYFWRVLYKEGSTLLQPKVGSAAPGAWIPSEDASNYEWLQVNTTDEGNYFYRLNFCIEEISTVNVLQGQIAGDNTIKTIRLDGIILVDFSQYDICESLSRLWDFKCYKNFSSNINNSLLTSGSHVLEIEIYNEPNSVTGMIINAQLLGVSGWVLPSIVNDTISGCGIKGLIRGVAYEDINFSKTKDAVDARLSNVKVSLIDLNNNIIQTVYTDSEGAYSFYGVDRSKDYKVICNPVSPYSQTSPVSPNYYIVHFDASTTIIANKDFGLNKNVTYNISGIVFNDKNQNRLRDSGENLLAGYTIQVFDQQNQLFSSTQTEIDGSYTISANFLQTYSVRVVTQTNEQITTPISGVYTFLLSDDKTGIDFGIFPNLINCEDCITEFSPIPGKNYIVSGWVKMDYSGTAPMTYSQAGIQIKYNSGTLVNTPLFTPSGPIVDGWQRIENEFQVPFGARNIQIILVNTTSNVEVYFDDIRVHPVNSNMRSFVYDPSTQKLTAELDENNFATIYEYDDEGILVRVKKETERGVMTIKETRTNQSKVQAIPGQ